MANLGDQLVQVKRSIWEVGQRSGVDTSQLQNNKPTLKIVKYTLEGEVCLNITDV